MVKTVAGKFRYEMAVCLVSSFPEVTSESRTFCEVSNNELPTPFVDLGFVFLPRTSIEWKAVGLFEFFTEGGSASHLVRQGGRGVMS